jgi:hypothetical protein
LAWFNFSKGYIKMSTRIKSVVAPLAVAPTIAFDISPVIVALASAVFLSDTQLHAAEVAFHRAVFADIAPGDLLPLPIGEKRGANVKAAFDFVQRAFVITQVGEACAAALYDPAVTSNMIVTPPANCRRGAQAKRALKNTVTGSKVWGVWLKGQVQLSDALVAADALAVAEAEVSAADKAAKAAKTAANKAVKAAKADPTVDVAAAKIAEQAASNAAQSAADALADQVKAAAAGRKAKSSTREKSSDMTFLSNQIGSIVKRLRRDADKFDGSFDYDKAQTLAAAFSDLAKVNGIK